jgi:hypothetical protein
MDGNNDIRFYASDVRLWIIRRTYMFFLLKAVVAVTKKEWLSLISLSHRAAGTLSQA